MRNVYVRVLKNSSLEILGNPIFFLLDSTGRARYRDTRSHETRGDVVEIECEPREELREAERQTRAYAYTERANFRGRKRASERASELEAAFYEGGWVRNRVEYMAEFISRAPGLIPFGILRVIHKRRIAMSSTNAPRHHSTGCYPATAAREKRFVH